MRLLTTFVVELNGTEMLNTKVEVFCEPFKRQPHKMVKHTQAIRWQFADDLFECV